MTRILLSAPLCPYIRLSSRFTCWPEMWIVPLATGACQIHNEDAYYGHLVMRLMGCLVLFYTSRVICKGRLTMEEIIFNLKHYWRFVDSEALELTALSQGMVEKAA